MEESGRGRERIRWVGKKEEEESKATIHGNGLAQFGGMNGISHGPPIPGYNHMKFLRFSIYFQRLRFCAITSINLTQIDIGSTIHMGCWEKRDNGHIAD